MQRSGPQQYPQSTHGPSLALQGLCTRVGHQGPAPSTPCVGTVGGAWAPRLPQRSMGRGVQRTEITHQEGQIHTAGEVGRAVSEEGVGTTSCRVTFRWRLDHSEWPLRLLGKR